MAVAWGLSVALITLTPGPPNPAVELIPSLCLVCGSRGTADAILNIVLFLPLGMVLGVKRGVAAALLWGVVVSAGIETAQLFLPGRNPAVGDVVWNGAGSGAGALLAAGLRGWLHGSPGFLPRVAAVSAGAVYLLLAGVLLEPSGTDSTYFAQWTPELEHFERYRGELLSATLDGAPVPRGAYPDGGSPRATLEGDFDLELRVVKGPPTRRLSPILSVYDGRRREIFVLGAHRQDLVWRERTWAQALALDYHDVRLHGALGSHAPGDTLQVGAWRQGGRLCLRVDERETCGVGVTPGRTWGLLMNLEGAPRRFRERVDTAWMATLFLMVGVLGGGALATGVAGVASAASVLLAVAVTPLGPPPILEWIGLALGIAAGAGLRPAIRVLVGGAARRSEALESTRRRG